MIKKLMAATSVAALIVGGANAQLALKQDTNNVSGDIVAPYVLASEVDFAKLNATGNTSGIGAFGLTVTTEGVIPPGQNIFLTIQVSGGTIASNLDGSEINAGITGAVVNSGGTVGATTVRYLITTDTTDQSAGLGNFAGKDGVSLTLPVRATGCGDVTFSVTEFQTETAGTPIEGGKASLTDFSSPAKVIPALTCESAFNASLVLDGEDSTLDLDATPAFSLFDLTTALSDTTTTAILGNFALALTPANIDMVGTAAAATDVLGFSADIDFSNTDEIVSGEAASDVGSTLFDSDGGAVVVSGNDINLVGTTPATGADTGTFELLISGTDPVLAQSVSASDAVLALRTTGTSLKATDPFTEADVEDLKYEGYVFGPFDWVSDSKRAVNSIFRVTGLSPDTDVPAQIILENSRNGDSFNGVYPFTILGSSVQGSEVRINSAQLEALAGVFGTADVTMVFSVDADLDVDRLNASPASSVVTPFGDGANQDGSGVGSTAPGTTNNDDDGNY
jgi:hypothetical protein